MFPWNRRHWVGFVPNGAGQVKPNHYFEILKVAWRNRRHLLYAVRILRKGVCDGCALGTTGLRDFTMKGIHLCTVRLNLLPLNTMDAFDPATLSDVSALRRKTSAELRGLGRIGHPMVRRKGDRGFHRISWDEALDIAATRIRASSPSRLAFYLTSRGISNEVYYVAQKVARFLGTNNVDNASRVCHSPSTTALKRTIGVGASTCSYKDWIGTDLLVLIGSDVANNQPVTTKYMYFAKQQGTRIVVINPYREPGLERYWVPSVLESAVFGTKLGDDFFQIHTGGDIAFLNGVLKHLLANQWTDNAFIDAHTSGFADVATSIDSQSWDDLERSSGASRDDMLRFARLYADAKSAVFVWSMGITQHSYGVDNVTAISNLALARGMIGRPKCGLMPIRGHSGVQGGAEVGCAPNLLPGGVAVTEESAADLAKTWGFDVPVEPGLLAVEMLDAAHAGEMDVFYVAGGNFLETLPDPDYVRTALERVPLRIHQDLVVTNQMLVEPADTVLILPARTRYEQEGGATETSTERYIYFSPEIAGHPVGEARSEWRIFMEIAERVDPDRRDLIHFESAQSIRGEIARTVPFYAGIEWLKAAGDAVQWGGPLLCEGGKFATPDGLAHFRAVVPPDDAVPEGMFAVSTRRGKQFNSMVWEERDPLTGAARDDVFISAADAANLHLRNGDRMLLRSASAEFRGRAKIVEIRPRNLQVHWPEGSSLLRRGLCDPDCGIPDYNAVVEVFPLGVAAPA